MRPVTCHRDEGTVKTSRFNLGCVTILEPISKIPMRGNGSDFVSCRGASTKAW